MEIRCVDMRVYALCLRGFKILEMNKIRLFIQCTGRTYQSLTYVS